MTRISIIALVCISLYVLCHSKRSRLEYLFLATYPYLNKLNQQVTLYFCLLIIIFNICEIIRHKKIRLRKEYFFLAIFVVYIVLTMPLYNIDINYYIGVRNFVFFTLSGYFVIEKIDDADIIGHIILFQSLSCFLVSIYEICLLYNFTFNQSRRSYGFFTNPNYYAFYLIFLLLLAIRYLKGKKLIFAFLILLPTSFLTLSAACFVIIAYIVYYYLFGIFFRGKIDEIGYFLITFFFLIVFFFLYKNPYGVYTFLDAETDRLQIWSVYASIFFRSNLLFGVGFNEELALYEKNLPSMHIYDYVGENLLKKGVMPTHNEFYKLLTTTGLIGFGLFFVGFFIYIKKIAKEDRVPNVGIVLFVMMLTHNVFFTITFWLLFFFPLKGKNSESNTLKIK